MYHLNEETYDRFSHFRCPAVAQKWPSRSGPPCSPFPVLRLAICHLGKYCRIITRAGEMKRKADSGPTREAAANEKYTMSRINAIFRSNLPRSFRPRIVETTMFRPRLIMSRSSILISFS